MKRKSMHREPTHQKNHDKESNMPVVILVLLVVGLGLYILSTTYSANILSWFSSPKKTDTAVVPSGSTPYVKPSPRPIPYEKQIFRISHGSLVTGPKPYEGTIEPYDPKSGETQRFMVKIKHTAAITSAVVKLTSDTKTIAYPLSLTGGSETDGTWSANWKTDDTHDYAYVFTIETKGIDGTSNVSDVTVR